MTAHLNELFMKKKKTIFSSLHLHVQCDNDKHLWYLQLYRCDVCFAKNALKFCSPAYILYDVGVHKIAKHNALISSNRHKFFFGPNVIIFCGTFFYAMNCNYIMLQSTCLLKMKSSITLIANRDFKEQICIYFFFSFTYMTNDDAMSITFSSLQNVTLIKIHAW